jgi:hypothetical protein
MWKEAGLGLVCAWDVCQGCPGPLSFEGTGDGNYLGMANTAAPCREGTYSSPPTPGSRYFISQVGSFTLREAQQADYPDSRILAIL